MTTRKSNKAKKKAKAAAKAQTPQAVEDELFDEIGHIVDQVEYEQQQQQQLAMAVATASNAVQQQQQHYIKLLKVSNGFSSASQLMAASDNAANALHGKKTGFLKVTGSKCNFPFNF